MILGSFLFFLLIFVGIGLWASTKHKDDTEDYLLAGRAVNPWMAGMSAAASLMSGFMFIGYIGLLYKIGLYGFWFVIGEVIGIIMLTPWLQKRIYEVSSREEIQTFSGLLGQRHGERYTKVVFLIGLITLFFLGLYAAGQLTAGGKALNSLFGWPEASGALIGAGILFLYSYTGGIRASIWTDSAQLVVMFTAMIALCVAGLAQVGGVSGLHEQLLAIDPKLVQLAPRGWMPAVLFITGWIFAGPTVLAMPHVAVRYMTVSSSKDAAKAQYVFLGALLLLGIIASTVALLARVLIADLGDPELALPQMTALILPEIFIGVVLAGVFASSMSSADSMVLSCSAALSQNIIPSWSRKYSRAKLSTLLVILSVVGISVWGPSGVFDIVIFAVGGMGAAFAPLLIIRALKGHPGEKTSIAMMVVGIATVVYWRLGLGLEKQMFEAAPGIVAGFLVYGVSYLWGKGKAHGNK